MAAAGLPVARGGLLLRRLATLLVLGLSVHVLIPRMSGFDETWQAVRALSWSLVAVALLSQVVSYLGNGLLIRGLVRLSGGSIGVGRAALISLAASGVGLVAAGIVGSSAATYAWVRRSGTDRGAAPTPGAGLVTALKPVFNDAVLLGIALFGVFHLLLLGDLSEADVLGAAVILSQLLLLTGALIWGATHPAALRRLLSALEAARSRLRGRARDPSRVERTVAGMREAWALARSGRWKAPLLGALINVGFDACCLYLLFAAAGERVGLGTLLSGYSIARLLGKASLIPGGLVVVEASMFAVFSRLGIHDANAVTAVLGYRALSLWIPAALGLPVAAYLQRDRTPPQSAE